MKTHDRIPATLYVILALSFIAIHICVHADDNSSFPAKDDPWHDTEWITDDLPEGLPDANAAQMCAAVPILISLLPSELEPIDGRRHDG